jgi:hypothetical protein
MIVSVQRRIALAGRRLLAGSVICLWLFEPSLAEIRKVDNVSLENLIDASRVAFATLDKVGQPISEADRKRLLVAWELSGDEGKGTIQDIMDRYCWLEIRIDEEAWLKAYAASPSPSDRTLVKGKWKAFLVKVYNESPVKAAVNVRSPQELSADELKEVEVGTDSSPPKPDSWYRWLGLKIYPNAIAARDFPGSTVRYLVLGIFSRDEGLRAADLEFYFSGGAVSQGHYVNKRLLFEAAAPADK